MFSPAALIWLLLAGRFENVDSVTDVSLGILTLVSEYILIATVVCYLLRFAPVISHQLWLLASGWILK